MLLCTLQKKYRLMAFVISFISANAYAEVTAKFIETNSIPAFQKSIALLKEKTKLPIIFPKKIPVFPDLTGYYVHVETQSNGTHYTISIDTTPDCEGKHNCTIGSLTASTGDNPQVYYSMDNKELTVPVSLTGGRKGYFTPSHAMADFWAPQIEWRDGNVLYRLSWNLVAKVPEKETLVNVVNSAY